MATKSTWLAIACMVGQAGAARAEEPQTKTGFEEIDAKAAEAGVALEAPSAAVSATAEAPSAAKAEEGPFALRVILDHSFGTGTFVQNDALRAYNDLISQTWDLRPSYTFNYLGHKLALSGRFMFDLILTTPNTNPARRFKPADASLTLSDKELYQESLTGVKFNAALRVYLPTSWESTSVKRQWTGVRGILGASRKFGPLEVAYTFSGTKYFNGSAVRSENSTLTRSGDVVISAGAAGEPSKIEAGYANVSFEFQNNVGVTYEFSEVLSISYDLIIINKFKYELYSKADPYTSQYAEVGRSRALDMLWPTLELSYKISDDLKRYVQLPFNLSVNGGITALHPAQSADNKEIIWPFFYQSFAQNRAANNYGSIYIDLVGTY